MTEHPFARWKTLLRRILLGRPEPIFYIGGSDTLPPPADSPKISLISFERSLDAPPMKILVMKSIGQCRVRHLCLIPST